MKQEGRGAVSVYVCVHECVWCVRVCVCVKDEAEWRDSATS